MSDRQAPAAARENPHAGQGSVLLDIGDDIGALVIDMPGSMLDEEVEIHPAGTVHQHAAHHRHPHGPGASAHEVTHPPHVAVVNRPVRGGQRPSLVYPELAEGHYDLCPKGTHDVRLTVGVRGGEVTFAEWPP
jgi:hypothetical protein